jgi:hypothetical protein
MKSKGLFPKRSAFRGTNRFGGTAGNSTSAYSAPNDDGYKQGMLGWRSSPRAGGQSMGQQSDNRPQPTDKGMAGNGGLAWDSSMSGYMAEKGKAS